MTTVVFLPLFLAWSRLNVGNYDPPLTCAGAPMSKEIAANMRGENPDVPVTPIARYPILDPFARLLANVHAYSAMLLIVLLWVQLIRPKGNDPKKGKSHMYVGRIVSWGMSWHYAPIGIVLNYFAINMPLEDWRLSPPVSDWRMQLSYIVPFGFNIVVVMCTGFFLNRYAFMPRSFAAPLKMLCQFNLFWFFTLGLAMPIAQVLGFTGTFGLKSPAAPGGFEGDPAQAWFRQFNLVAIGLTTQQALFDYINLKVCETVLASGNDELSWKDMHKWSMLDLCFQAFAIFGAFFAYFPFCLYEGFPDWSCFSEIPFAVPIIGAFFVPFLPQMPWLYRFCKAAMGGKLKEFSAPDSHAWDTKKQAALY